MSIYTIGRMKGWIRASHKTLSFTVLQAGPVYLSGKSLSHFRVIAAKRLERPFCLIWTKVEVKMSGMFCGPTTVNLVACDQSLLTFGTTTHPSMDGQNGADLETDL